MPDTFPLLSDPSKTTAEQEGWAVNATERFLKAGASSISNAVARNLPGGLANIASGAAAISSAAARKETIIEGQWLRKVSLIVYGATTASSVFGTVPPGSTPSKTAPGAVSVGRGGTQVSTGAQAQGKDAQQGIDLSELRINFRLKKFSSSSPNFLEARVYNLSGPGPDSPNTISKVKQYGRVQLAAGYESNFGMIFDGTVILYIVGKENPVDSFIDIKAGDQDELNNAAVGLTWPSGTSNKQKVEDMIKAAGGKVGELKLGPYGDQKSLRSTSFIGMLEKGIRAITNAAGADYYIDNGKHHVISWTGYQVDEIIELSPTTGLVGIPKVTPAGIEAQCLLNPKLRLGTLVKIDSTLLSDVPYVPGSKDNPFAGGPSGSIINPAYPTFTYPSAAVNPKGVYKILLLEHHGDTRGTTWYSSFIGVGAGEKGEILNQASGGTALLRTRAQGVGPQPK